MRQMSHLQNISLNRDVPLAAWTPWLGTRTAQAWKVLDDLWSGRLPKDQFNSYIRGQVT